MAKIKILSDSSCDLSPELLQKYDIGIIPFYINLGGTALLDGVEIDSQGIFDYVAKNGILPGTIACSVDNFKQTFEKWRGEGYEVICHVVSSDMSGCSQNARIAAEGMDGIHIVDSRNLSSGVGHVVLNAAIMAQQGMATTNIVKALEDIIPKVRSSFILDNLEYMRKGGRCSSIALLGSNLLKIKPEILVEDGKMKVGHKFRGPFKRVLEEYVDMRLADPSNIRPDRIFITHTGCSDEIISSVRERIEANIHFDEVIETYAGATITSHCGPNTLGILYIEK
jgi:DegV family protein with EDD domain